MCDQYIAKILLQVSCLSVYGGKSGKDTVKRVLKHLMSARLGEQYSWYGKKGKINFGNLKLASVIYSKFLQRLRICLVSFFSPTFYAPGSKIVGAYCFCSVWVCLWMCVYTCVRVCLSRNFNIGHFSKTTRHINMKLHRQIDLIEKKCTAQEP